MRAFFPVHESETDISPINYERSEPANEYVREWQTNSDWLNAYWRLEDKSVDEIKADKDRSWRYLPLERRDLDYLERRGFPADPGLTRKGQIYDIMGLCEMPTALQAQQLRFFDVKEARLNRTTAEREVRWLMESPINRNLWEQRPMDPIQSIFFKLLDVNPPNKLKATEAQAIITEILTRGSDNEDAGRADWVAFESIYSDLSSEYAAATRGIRRPTPELVFTAFESLRRDGKSAMDLYIQIDIVVKRLLEVEPRLKLSRRRTEKAPGLVDN